ncbi:MAG TPA: nucleotidyltransferase family protein [Candidatus Limiplasma sp.]|nr:nucleotidyltransferase family protein [Candidatus Limiplasma sp.]
MKNIVGIICEYDPFHRGHARQFSLIRAQLPDALIVCLMSGCFTQRGMPALFSPAFRAKAALEAGADIVLELPTIAAVRDAENFALGGVGIFNRLGFISQLSFGTENPDLSLLGQIAHLLEHPDAVFQTALQQSLAQGKPFAAAQADGVAAALGQADTAAVVSKPNNILAICYLRALDRLQSSILPLPVKRDGSYHSASLSDAVYPSASAVRSAYLTGDLKAAESACGYALSDTDVHRPDALDAVLLNTLRSLPADALKSLPDCSEGLENRLKQSAAQATNQTELLSLLKTRRYTHTRLNRLLIHAMLGLNADLLRAYPQPPYVRLLGFRKEREPALALLRNAQIPVIAKASEGDKANPLYQLDERAYDLWALGAKLPAGLMYRQQIVIV